MVPFCLMGSNASAYVVLHGWTLDLKGVLTGFSTHDNVENLNWDSPGDNTTIITQYLGDDNTLNDYDPFIETGFMQGFTVTTTNNPATELYDLYHATTQYYMFAVFEDVTGYIYNYDDQGNVDPTDDTWDYTFDNGSGTVGIYLDTDTDPFNGIAYTLMTGDIVSISAGTADGFLGGPGVGSSNWGMTLDVTYAYPDVWLDTDGTTDLWEAYGATLLLALAQGVTNIDAAPEYGFDPGVGQDGWQFVRFFGHTGDTMEIAAVPEPATMLLFGSGLIGLAALGRNKFRK